MKNKFVKSIFLFFFSLFLISSCKKNKAVLDVSVFQSITPTEQWAVVVDSYVSFYADSSKKASVQANGRRGDVLEMQGEKWVRVLNGKEKWYFFEKGWLEQSSIAIYSNALQAQKASQILLGD